VLNHIDASAKFVIQHNDTNTTSVIKNQLQIQAEQDISHKRTYDAIS
jgi:hypothetical protein